MIRLITKEEINKLIKEIDYKISNNAFEKCFVYELKKEIIGLLDFSHIYNRLELNYIWIKDDYRSQGYSKKLMDYLLSYSKDNNIDNITLEVSVNNEIALNLYKSFGFKEVAIRNQYYNGIDGILMIRKFDDNE